LQERKIAVISVHGVGDRICGEMAANVVRQLQLSNPADYRHFETTPFGIPVTATELRIGYVPPREEAGKSSKLWPKGADSRLMEKQAPTHESSSCDVVFTETLLENGAAYRADYQTQRLTSSFEKSGTRTTVDVHEMFWADLSHGGLSNALAVFSELMQFFLHMASLGRTTLAGILKTLTRAERDHAKVDSMYNASTFGYWLLAIPILMGNVLFVMFGLLLLTMLIPDKAQMWAKVGAAVAGGAIASLPLASYVRKRFRSPSVNGAILNWGVSAVAVTAALVSGGLYLLRWDDYIHPRNVLFALEAVVLVYLGTVLMARYDKSRPEALLWWKYLLGVVLAWGLACGAYLWSRPQERSPDLLLGWFDLLAEGCFIGLLAAWVLVYLCNFRLLYLSLRAKLVAPAVSLPVNRAINTSLIAASIPAPLFISAILFVWVYFASYLAGRDWPRLHQPIFKTIFSGDSSILGVVNGLLGQSVNAAFLPYLACLLIAFIATVIGILPSLIAEFAPPSRQAPARSLELGNWLDGGFRILFLGWIVALIGFFFLLPLGMAVQWVPPLNDGLQKLGLEKIVVPAGFGELVGGSMLALLASSKLIAGASLGRLSRAFRRLRVVIDTAIDVDNWLREQPVGATSRLRIMARYVSLLKEIADRDYDRIVIVAHSQGAVITADLFRYLVKHNSALVAKLKGPALFTLGCPLRQLYAQRFPGLYGWAENAPLDGSGFSAWINAYGSGDYVGRYLWGAPSPDRWIPRRAEGQHEFCVGALAHTHYFDKHAPEVGIVLNQLIYGN
jgi:hypothetical protein